MEKLVTQYYTIVICKCGHVALETPVICWCIKSVLSKMHLDPVSEVSFGGAIGHTWPHSSRDIMCPGSHLGPPTHLPTLMCPPLVEKSWILFIVLIAQVILKHP